MSKKVFWILLQKCRKRLENQLSGVHLLTTNAFLGCETNFGTEGAISSQSFHIYLKSVFPEINVTKVRFALK